MMEIKATSSELPISDDAKVMVEHKALLVNDQKTSGDSPQQIANRTKEQQLNAAAAQILSTLQEDAEMWPIWKGNINGVRQLIFALSHLAVQLKFNTNVYWNGETVITNGIKDRNENIWEFHFTTVVTGMIVDGKQALVPKALLKYRVAKQFSKEKHIADLQKQADKLAMMQKLIRSK